MTTLSYILATAGHIDHGKSSLVKALTGIDPDRLPEEKARGITIDLGFAHLSLAVLGTSQDAKLLQLGIVDVPGHEDFVKNMVSGVGAVDAALLVIAADDGWMPQTEEHLQILNYLGVRRGVVALTKVDLAQSEEESIAQVRQKLLRSSLADAPIVSTSIINGRGMDELKLSVACALADASPQADIGKPRLSVDRAFSIAGAGTIVTGTLIGGTFRRGQSVLVQPAGLEAKIRALQTHNREVDVALPGTRVALNLPHLQPGQKSRPQGPSVRRGDVITVAGLGEATETADVMLERSERLSSESAAGRPIKDGTLVRVHHGTGNVPARIYFQDRDEGLPGQRAIAQLRFDEPLFVFADDRFIVRDGPERHTLAGGTILDPRASRSRFRTPQRQKNLTKLTEARTAAERALAHLNVEPVLPRASVLAQSHFSAAQIEAAIQQLASEKQIVATEKIVTNSKWWQEFCRLATDAIDGAHRENPERAGLPLSELRQTLHNVSEMDDTTFEALLDHLTRNGFTRYGPSIGRNSHRPALPAHLQAAGNKIRAVLNARPMDPPSRKELTPDTAPFQALKFLLTNGEAVEVGPELVLARASYEKAIETIRNELRGRGSASVAELRQALNTTRRVMVPLLEKLDREGITQRQGDRRVLRQQDPLKLQ